MTTPNRGIKLWLGGLSLLWLVFVVATALHLVAADPAAPEVAGEETVAETAAPPAEEEAAEPAPEEVADEDVAEEPEEEETREAFFTQEQAGRGEDAYLEHCARCHGDDLRGSPPLVGEGFLARWDSVGELLDYNRTQMPLDNPGSLGDDTYAEITAFILQENGFPAGDEELPADLDKLEAHPLDPQAAEPEEVEEEAEPEAEPEEAAPEEELEEEPEVDEEPEEGTESEEDTETLEVEEPQESERGVAGDDNGIDESGADERPLRDHQEGRRLAEDDQQD